MKKVKITVATALSLPALIMLLATMLGAQFTESQAWAAGVFGVLAAIAWLVAGEDKS